MNHCKKLVFLVNFLEMQFLFNFIERNVVDISFWRKEDLCITTKLADFVKRISFISNEPRKRFFSFAFFLFYSRHHIIKTPFSPWKLNIHEKIKCFCDPLLFQRFYFTSTFLKIETSLSATNHTTDITK